MVVDLYASWTPTAIDLHLTVLPSIGFDWSFSTMAYGDRWKVDIIILSDK